MIQKVENTAYKIASFIASWLSDKPNFECRSFYGETFSLALLQKTKLLDDITKLKLLNAYDNLDKTDSKFHWEFNNYALLDYYTNTKDLLIDRFLKPIKFKNTPCTNWTLLRSNARLMAGVDTLLAIKESKTKIQKFQLNSGLILDDPGVKSFQYHCFSMAMIGEIYEQTNDVYFYNSFLNGVEFIRHFILSNGETLYIGRGQNQSFGYGVLLYILALAYKFTNDKTILGDIELVIGFLSRFQREDGSFPLVMNEVETSIPKLVDMQNPEFAGWYPYNNYFDYLPFMGFFIAKAFETLNDLDTSVIEYTKQKDYRDSDFIKLVNPGYEAVLSKPGGYWTNDLPIPYIVTNGKNLTPCYGGEQFQKSLYTLKGIPLPYCNSINKSIRWHSKSWFFGNTLWLLSPLGIMKREFLYDDELVEIKTKIYSFFDFQHIYLFLDDDRSICNEVDNMILERYEYSANGKLKMYSDIKNSAVIKIRLIH